MSKRPSIKECQFGVPLDDLNPEGPLDPKEIYSAITGMNLSGTGVAVAASQIVGNAYLRHILGNAALFTDVKNGSRLGLTETLRKEGVGVLTRGVTSRLEFGLYGMFPALLISQKMKEMGYTTAAAAAVATSYETIVGTMMEAKSAMSSLARDGKPGIADGRMAGVYRAIVPFVFRNYFAWVAFSCDKDTPLIERVFTGLGAGIASAIPNTIGNKAMVMADTPVLDALGNAVKGIKLPDLAKSAGLRGIGGAASAAVLSPQAAGKICKTFDWLISEYKSSFRGREGADIEPEDTFSGLKVTRVAPMKPKAPPQLQ